MKVAPGIYEHYKGEKVRVIGIGKHSETLEDLVLYEAPTNMLSKFWARPVAMFLEEVEVNGTKVPRFRYISER